MTTLNSFAVRNLFSSFDISMPINSDNVIIVGPNGVGKSTIANMLYFTLSGQWHRLLEYDFDSIEIEVNYKYWQIKRDEIEEIEDSLSQSSRMPKMLRHRIDKLRRYGFLDRMQSSKRLSNSEAQALSDVLGIPVKEVETFRKHIRSRLSQYELSLFADSSKLQSITSEVESKIIYLPTYRRIERELQSIFPDLEDYVRRYTGGGIHSGRRADHYIELVSFGMEDVTKIINKTLSDLKEQARTQLNNLAGSYLRDVIRGAENQFDLSVIKDLAETDVLSILDRMEERILLEKDKTTLVREIKAIQARGKGRLSMRQKYLAHYVAKLDAVGQELKQQDRHVRDFVSVCNRYLFPKKSFRYDDVSYELKIENESGQEISLSSLSSGEKQIVSIFSHIYLDESSSFIIIIDEPELSLSVPWQKTFLIDIVESGRVDFMFSVTHSPFIFDNELEYNTYDLRNYVRVGE